MTKFLIKTFLFISPFIILLGVPYVILRQSGELVSVASVITKQALDPKIVYGQAYSDVTPYYKLQSALARTPDVLVLGPSTAMQFSSSFFVKPELFYNAGGAISKLRDFGTFLELIPKDKTPKLIFMIMPQFYFKPNLGRSPDDRSLVTNISAEEKFLSMWPKVWGDIFNSKISLSDALTDNDRLVGVQARKNLNGYLGDGSYTWGAYVNEEKEGTLKELQEQRHTDAIAEFKANISRTDGFTQGGPKPDISAIKELEIILAEASKRNIKVIGILPPSHPHELYEFMKEEESNAGYYYALSAWLSPIFSKYGHALYDYSDVNSFGSSDLEFYDINHATRKAYSRILLNLAEIDKELSPLIDIVILQNALKVSTSTLDI